MRNGGLYLIYAVAPGFRPASPHARSQQRRERRDAEEQRTRAKDKRPQPLSLAIFPLPYFFLASLEREPGKFIVGVDFQDPAELLCGQAVFSGLKQAAALLGELLNFLPFSFLVGLRLRFLLLPLTFKTLSGRFDFTSGSGPWRGSRAALLRVR